MVHMKGPAATELTPAARPRLVLPDLKLAARPSGPEEDGFPMPVADRYITSRRFDSDFNLESRVLGSGQSGDVRLASCKETGRMHAVKKFNKAKLSRAARSEMHREVDVYLSLDHPNIARLDRVYESDEAVHLVMEHLEGGELFDALLERDKYEEDAAARILVQVLEAVEYMHDQKVVHRDIKLENVLYERNGADRVKVIDFGFAVRWDRQNRLTQSCGTLHYVAPEVIADNDGYTESADLWSVGAIAYTMLTGKAPYQGDDRMVKSKVLAGAIDYSKRFRHLSTGAQAFVRALLSFEPEHRPTAAEALAHPWLLDKTAVTSEEQMSQKQVPEAETLGVLPSPCQAKMSQKEVPEGKTLEVLPSPCQVSGWRGLRNVLAKLPVAAIGFGMA